MSQEARLFAREPQPLTKADAAALKLPWSSLLSRDDLVRHVGRYPRMSWYVPGTHSYVIAGPWRNRRDIVEIFESRGESQRPALWAALLEGSDEPYSVALVDPSEYRSAPAFYKGVGVRPIEDVLVLRTSSLPGPPVEITLEMHPMRSKGVGHLLAIDHSAFPWLWRNSREEFEEYLDTPGVGLWLGMLGDQSVGYVGFTELGGWGHIDRLAVSADRQGNGYGGQLLSWALGRLQAAGARYVQLSTQGSNEQSQGLYTRFGFRPTRGGFKLYGLYLSHEETL